MVIWMFPSYSRMSHEGKGGGKGFGDITPVKRVIYKSYTPRLSLKTGYFLSNEVRHELRHMHFNSLSIPVI